MNTRTQSPIQTSIENAIQQLLERATAQRNVGRPQLLRWLMLIGGAFLAWKALRGLKSLFWTAFGLGMAVYWTGLWRVWF